MGELLLLTPAAERFGLDRHVLRDAADGERVRAHWIDGRRHFDVDELEEDINRLRCPYVLGNGRPCGRVAIGASGGCEAHGHTMLGNRAAGVPRPDIGPKIAAAKKGHVTPLETRAKQSRAKRRREPKRRYCRWCGKKITRTRAGLDKLGLSEAELDAELERLGLDLVPGSALENGEGKYCSVTHHLVWAWVNDPERFPQTSEKGKELWRAEMQALWRKGHTRSTAAFRAWWREQLTTPAARRKWLPLWTLLEETEQARHRKGESAAREAAEYALKALEWKPDLDKRDLFDLLILQFEGRDCIATPDGARRPGRDPVYHNARLRVLNRLRRGFELLDRPAVLKPFI
jgi:hypothetical protein